MGYSSLASSIRSKTSTLSDAATAISAIDFDSIWKGAAHDNMTGALDAAVKELKSEVAILNSFASVLDSVQLYKDNRGEISSLVSQYNNTPNTQAYIETKKYLYNAWYNLVNENKTLKTKIINALSAFDSETIDINSISINLGTTTNYVLDIQSLLAKFESGQLRKMDTGDSLYKYVSEAEVRAILTNIQNNYSGREAAVNSALAMLSIAADQGFKLDYEHKATNPYVPYVPTAQVASGVDCNPFASWVVDKGTPGGFQWRPVESFKSVGTSINYEDAQPGDIFVVKNDVAGHVGVIIQNNPEDGTFICAEASGQNVGIILQTRSYSSMKKTGYSVKDMTNVYNGTESTYRPIFEKYVNMETYEREF